MKRLLVLVLIASGCDTAPPEYCVDGVDTRFVGAWRASSIEAGGGECGPLLDDIFAYPSHGTGIENEGIEVNWGQVLDYDCGGPARGTHLYSSTEVQASISHGPVEPVDDDHITATIRVRQSTASGEELCVSSYLVEMERDPNVIVPP